MGRAGAAMVARPLGGAAYPAQVTSAGPVPPVLPPVGVLLAAGAGRRAGGPKALRRDGDGPTWVVAGVRTLARGGCSPVIVTVGCRAGEVAAVLAATEPEAPVAVVIVDDWETGQSASVRAGLTAASATGAPAAVVHLVDLPDVGPEVVRRVLDGADASSLHRASYHGRPGHPVVLGRDHLGPVLDSLHGDQGARGHLQRAPGVRLIDCSDLATGDDVDHG